ncbi:MAG: hypothetical protein AMXMBFR46_24230 [Acidimicrobiia bacterium]
MADVTLDDAANPSASPSRSRAGHLIGVLLAGAAVSIALGVYGKEHAPTFERPFSLFFTDTINLKVWFATIAVVLAIVQLAVGLRLWGTISWPARTPDWLGDLHRLLGTLAFVFTLPVAFLCLWSLGFQDTNTRVVVHSLLGCFVYGAFTVKVLSVRMHRLPGWLLPAAGGAVFAALVGIWLTSSFWFFRHVGFPEL